MFRSLNKCEYFRRVNFKISLNMNANILHGSNRCKSHYSSLGLEPNASPKEIKSAYYDLSLKFHPDKNDGSALATEKFREITEAYEVLSNPEKKKIYDQDFSFDKDTSKGYYSTRAHGYYNQKPSSPRSGRTEHYDYDEHYRQHYENYHKQREAEQEQFRRRWEADRRYRYGDEYAWSRVKYERNYPRPPVYSTLIRSKAFVYFMTFWVLMGFFSLIVDSFNPDEPRNKPLYYKTSEQKSKPLYYKTNTSDNKTNE